MRERGSPIHGSKTSSLSDGKLSSFGSVIVRL